MRIFDKKNIIKISSEDIKDARLSTMDFSDEQIRKRAFANVLGARLGMKFLFSRKIEANNIYSLYTIQNVLKNIDIADVYSNEIKIDVRVIFNPDEIFIPKDQFKTGILPDIYLTLLLKEDLSEAECLGFFEPKYVDEKNENADYFFFEKEDLKRPDELKSFLESFTPELRPKSSEEIISKCEEMFLSIVDEEISQEDLCFALKHLAFNYSLREKFVELENFELMSKQVAKDETLLKDNVLDIIGAQKVFDEENFDENLIEEINFENIIPDEEVNEFSGFTGEDLELLSSLEEADDDHKDNDNKGGLAASAIEGAIIAGGVALAGGAIAASTANVAQNIAAASAQGVTEGLVSAGASIIDSMASNEDPFSFEEIINDENILIEDESSQDEDFAIEDLSWQEDVSDEIVMENIQEPQEDDDLADFEESDLEFLQGDDEESEENENSESDEIDFAQEVFIAESEEENDDEEIIIDSIEDEQEYEQEDGQEEEQEFSAIDDLNSEVSDEQFLEFDNFEEVNLLIQDENSQEICDLNQILPTEELPQLENIEEQDEQTISFEDLPEIQIEKENLNEDVTVFEELEQFEVDSDLIEENNETESQRNDEEIFSFEALSGEKNSKESELQDESAESKSDEEINLNELEEMEELETGSDQDVEIKEENEEKEEKEENEDDLTIQVDDFLKDLDLSEQQKELISGELDINLDMIPDVEQEIPEISLAQVSKPESIYDEYPSAANTEQLEDHSSQSVLDEDDKDLLQVLFKKEQIDLTPEIAIGNDEEVKVSAISSKKKIIAASVAGVVLVSLIAGGVSMMNSKNSPATEQISSTAIPAPSDSVAQGNMDPNLDLASQSANNSELSLDMAQPSIPASGNATVQQDPQRDMGRAVSDALMSEPINASVSKVAWEVPEEFAYNDVFRRYLQTAGKNIKLSLQNDLLLATEMAYSDKVVIDLKLGKDGSLQSSDVIVSSGAKQIDKIVLQSVKATLKYLKPPVNELGGQSVTATLIINF